MFDSFLKIQTNKNVRNFIENLSKKHKNELIEKGASHLHCLDFVDSKNLFSIHLFSIFQFTSFCHNYL